MLREDTCCFTGHRILSQAGLENKLKDAVLSCMTKGVKHFCSGGALGFDLLAASVILSLKASYPELRLIMLLPCENQTKGWKVKDKRLYDEILIKADEVILVSQDYFTGCMQKRNRALIERSAYCICYLNQTHGGTAYTVNYAKGQGLEILNLA